MTKIAVTPDPFIATPEVRRTLSVVRLNDRSDRNGRLDAIRESNWRRD